MQLFSSSSISFSLSRFAFINHGSIRPSKYLQYFSMVFSWINVNFMVNLHFSVDFCTSPTSLWRISQLPFRTSLIRKNWQLHFLANTLHFLLFLTAFDGAFPLFTVHFFDLKVLQFTANDVEVCESLRFLFYELVKFKNFNFNLYFIRKSSTYDQFAEAHTIECLKLLNLSKIDPLLLLSRTSI